MIRTFTFFAYLPTSPHVIFACQKKTKSQLINSTKCLPKGSTCIKSHTVLFSGEVHCKYMAIYIVYSN